MNRKTITEATLRRIIREEAARIMEMEQSAPSPVTLRVGVAGSALEDLYGLADANGSPLQQGPQDLQFPSLAEAESWWADALGPDVAPDMEEEFVMSIVTGPNEPVEEIVMTLEELAEVAGIRNVPPRYLAKAISSTYEALHGSFPVRRVHGQYVYSAHDPLYTIDFVDGAPDVGERSAQVAVFKARQ